MSTVSQNTILACQLKSSAILSLAVLHFYLNPFKLIFKGDKNDKSDIFGFAAGGLLGSGILIMIGIEPDVGLILAGLSLTVIALIEVKES